jgi:hypothetical protein
VVAASLGSARDGVEESPDSTGRGCWREPGRGDLPVQGNREQTADGARSGDRRCAQARVKRCGKSAPASGVTPAARQPPPGARPSVGRPARPLSPGRPQRWMATRWRHPPGSRAPAPPTESGLQADSPSPTTSDQGVRLPEPPNGPQPVLNSIGQSGSRCRFRLLQGIAGAGSAGGAGAALGGTTGAPPWLDRAPSRPQTTISSRPIDPTQGSFRHDVAVLDLSPQIDAPSVLGRLDMHKQGSRTLGPSRLPRLC